MKSRHFAVTVVLALVILAPTFVRARGAQAPPPSPPAPAATAAPAMTIHQAATTGDLGAVKQLLEKDPTLLEAKDEEAYATPLAFAAGFGHAEVVRLLLAKGANVNARDDRGITPLFISVWLKQTECVRLLLDKGAALDVRGPSAMTPLHVAASGPPELAALLLERKADTAARNELGNTPLLLAVREGTEETVKVLVEGGADVNAPNPMTGDGPLEVALQEGRPTIADYLRSKGARPRAEAAIPRRGLYLGEKPPGPTPIVFAPNLVSNEKSELNAVFSPDGKEFYFAKRRGDDAMASFVVRQENGVWGRPQMLTLAGDYSFVDMFVSPDGRRLFFCSNRPLDGKGQAREDHDIWVATRTEAGWGEPVNLGETVNSARNDYYPTLTAKGDLYFSSRRDGGKGRNDIYRARLVDGRFQGPENLGAPINTEAAEYDPFITPDESTLIFASTRSGGLGNSDLWISFRGADGSWSEPRNLGAPINTPHLEYTPMLSPDGKYLFFTSGRGGADDIYWVEAGVIDTLRPKR